MDLGVRTGTLPVWPAPVMREYHSSEVLPGAGSAGESPGMDHPTLPTERDIRDRVQVRPQSRIRLARLVQEAEDLSSTSSQAAPFHPVQCGADHVPPTEYSERYRQSR